MENDPTIGINLGETHFEMTRDNSFLYTFLGKAAIYNHIWLKRDDLPPTGDDSLVQSTYLFENMTYADKEREQRWAQIYGALVLRMTELEYPLYLNQARPADCDVNAYVAANVQNDDFDHVPEGWE
jgi:hypothetical protein